MEAFVSRKRRRISPLSEDRPVLKEGSSFGQDHDEDSTDLRLATLASLYPELEQTLLLDTLISAEGSVEAAAKSLNSFTSLEEGRPRPKVVGYQSSLSIYRVPQKSGIQSLPSKTARLTRRGQTLHLYSPEDVAEHTPCSIIHNFLPPKEAEDLLKELLDEAPTFERQTFKLFDNVVQSPHSACFFVRSLEEQKRQQTEYLYNGSYLTVWTNHGLRTTRR